MPATVQSIDANKAEAGADGWLSSRYRCAQSSTAIDTIYGVPGIPIHGFGARMAQAEGIRVISFRHEQNAGNAAAKSQAT